MTDGDETGSPKKKRRAPWWVLSSYFAEGFPLFMLRSTIPYFLREGGRSLKEVGSVQLLFIPWTIKFLWAPIVDLYATKKRWIIGTEIAIAVFLVAMAFWMALNPNPSLKVWDLATGKPVRTVKSLSGKALSVAVLADGGHLLAGDSERKISRWDMSTGERVAVFEGHSAGVRALALSPDERQLFSGSDDETIRRWDLATGRQLGRFEGHEGPVTALALTRDGRFMVSASRDKTLRTWDLNTGEPRLTLQGHTDAVHAVAVTPDGRYAVSASADKTLRVWDLKTGVTSRTFSAHTGAVEAVVVTPDGRYAISGGEDGQIRKWEIATGETVRVFDGHQKGVTALALTPDGKSLVSGGGDKSLRLWDVATGEAHTTFAWLDEEGAQTGMGVALALVISADGARLVSGSNNALQFEGWPLVIFLLLVFVGCTLSATQDIAIDAAYVENLSPHEQEAWAGTRVAAYRLSKIVGTSLVIVISGFISWPVAMFSAAGFFAFMAYLHAKVLPTTTPRSAEDRPSPFVEFKQAIVTFARRDQAIWILLFAFTFKLGDGLLFAMNSSFTHDIGVSRIGVGVLGSTDTVFTLIGALFGAWVIMKVRLSRALIPLGILFNTADLLYAWYAGLGLDPETIQNTAFLVTGFEQFVGAMGTAAYSVAFVFFARGKHAASHFALLTAIMGLEVLAAGPVGGYMAQALGWENYFVFCFGMGIPGLLLAYKVLPSIRRIESEQPAE